MDEPEDRIYLLRISRDGKVVAEAPLRIYDAQVAFEVFMSDFANELHKYPGMILQGMSVACSPETKDSAQGVVMNIEQRTQAPQIVVPTHNGHISELERKAGGF